MKQFLSLWQASGIFLVVLFIFTAFTSTSWAQPSGEGETLLLWPEGVPDAKGSSEKDQPTVTVFLPDEEKSNGTGVVVFPGGGYSHLAMDHEGYQVAQWLNGIGVAAFVVKYRLGERYRHPAQLADGQRALRFVRSNAHDWGVSSNKIGVLGFSAGGHLASTVGTHFDPVHSNAGDPVDKQHSRPDFMVLVYPVITMQMDYTHEGSRHHLLGDKPDQELVDLLSNEQQVTDQTPPTFIIHGSNDTGVPVQNSLQFYEALLEFDIPAEMHLFEDGPHGFGLAPNDPELSQWTTLCERWMKSRGFLN